MTSSSGRTPTRRFNLAAVAALVLAAPASALKTEILAVKTVASGQQTLEVTSGQAMLHFPIGTSAIQVDAALQATRVRRLRDFDGGWFLVGWDDGASVGPRLEALKFLSGVLAADPNRVYRLFRTPNDPLFNSQYALAQVSAPAGWEYEVGNSNRVTIAVVDSGIDGTQPDLLAKLANTTSRYFDPNSGGAASVNNPPTPACNHATHVAGVAAASTDDGNEIAGMSWGAQLVSYKVFRDADCATDINCGSVTCATNDTAIIDALNQSVADATTNAAVYGKMVVNMSLGAAGPCSDSALQTAITNANAQGIVVVASAGNDGSAVNFPGNCAGVIPMGATDNTDQVASFSSRGAALAANGLVAPGVALVTTDEGGGTASATGTSFSSPMGAGLAALILSAKPTFAPAQVQTAMRAGADDIGQSASTQGAGRMNAFRSLRYAVKGTLAGFDGDQKPIAFPNPFRLSQGGAVTFSFPQSIEGAGTDVKIYTMDGRFVRELDEPLWDGKNASGELVASGSYVFIVKSGKGSGRGRMAVIR